MTLEELGFTPPYSAVVIADPPVEPGSYQVRWLSEGGLVIEGLPACHVIAVQLVDSSAPPKPIGCPEAVGRVIKAGDTLGWGVYPELVT